MAVTNWNDPLDDASWNTSTQTTLLFGFLIMLDFLKEEADFAIKKKSCALFYLKVVASIFAIVRNIVAAYISGMWAFSVSDDRAYVAHRVLVMLTWFMTFYMLYFRLKITFIKVEKQVVIGGRVVLVFLFGIAIAECFGCLTMSTVTCWSIFDPAISMGYY
ncbi:hypothetical protein HK099_004898 [Clydaea vesicula]|uniref:Uncharacterized protein n=1 Tax=Clydaea vesicula TaxID=447962 RepID=A0AAD5TZV3_9FUNG|nr:hypothetical protein HK099_004898 [Clydaea vesicula]KAJ3386828.1 hypothetical protein HDU92_002234 [Lobulomyces angularis]